MEYTKKNVCESKKLQFYSVYKRYTANSSTQKNNCNELVGKIA